ncbi:MFS transporter [Williamsia herbipolensis]|uniref:MFS transporter n=1 Tax=Williamsia herbipolensis TaxID=1603258 RepID=UPI0005F878A6|nr:MFS transporter [Williamsia herbipolensis]
MTDTDITASTADAGERGISRALVAVFAITAGVTVSAIYCLQPLLEEIRGDFHISSSTTSLVVTAPQLGYAAGLLLLVPLGDRLDRRVFAPALLVASAIALLVSGLAPNFPMLLVASLAVGVFAGTAQVVVPWSSSLAAPHERGRVVGTVMSGLLIGILLARVVSGLIAGLGGWRLVLFVTSALMLALAIVVFTSTPSDGPRSTQPYGRLLLSVATMVRDEAVLRHRMLLGFLTMFGFSAMWTSVAFLLAGTRGEHYHFSETAIGLFGLAGVAGAAGAPLVGRLADRGRSRLATTSAWLIIIVGWFALGWSGESLVALIIGLLVFDLGVQASQLSNQTAIYALAPEARSRVTTAYMVTYFLGAVAGSVCSGVAYGVAGWLAVCAIGLAAAVVGLALWGAFDRLERRAAASV